MHSILLFLAAHIYIAWAAGGIVALLLLGLLLAVRRRIIRVDTEKFQAKWTNEVQRLCSKSESWPEAVVNADRLLDEALKKCRCKGRTMGERLVAAQRRLSDNDGIWFAHKLSNKIAHEEIPRLYKRDVQAALKSIRQALRDLGALDDD